MTVRIITADVFDGLRQLDDGSVHCVVTSPPYFGLRDYGTASWEGGDADCDHAYDRTMGMRASTLGGGKASQPKASVYRECPKCGAERTDKQIGLEPTPDAYVAKMVEVFREVRRVIRKDATVWLNLGDSYAGGGNYRGINSEETLSAKQRSNGGARGVSQALGAKNTPGKKPKDLIGIPWMVAFALQADGWWLRQDIIWSKPNPMPESVTDRCTKAHEYLFLLTKAERYHFDASAIAEAVTDSTVERLTQPNLANQKGSDRVPGKTNGPMKAVGTPRNDGARWNENNGRGFITSGTRNKRSVWEVTTQPFPEAHFATFPPALIEPCIKAGCPKGGTVLDPFGGSGTTGLVSDRLGRNGILIELSAGYAEMARRRIAEDCPLFTEAVAI